MQKPTINSNPEYWAQALEIVLMVLSFIFIATGMVFTARRLRKVSIYFRSSWGAKETMWSHDESAQPLMFSDPDLSGVSDMDLTEKPS